MLNICSTSIILTLLQKHRCILNQNSYSPASHGHHIAARLAADENHTLGSDEEPDFTFKHTQSESICQSPAHRGLGQIRTHMQTGRSGVLGRANHYTQINHGVVWTGHGLALLGQRGVTELCTFRNALHFQF